MRAKFTLLFAVLVAMSLFGAFTGRVFANHHPGGNWETRQDYELDTLYGQANGKSWSPVDGVLSGEVYYNANDLKCCYGFPTETLDGTRRAIAEASYVKWAQSAINWMNSNSGVPSIAFHVFDYSGCPFNWHSDHWYATSLPGASGWLYWRCGDSTEGRVEADKTQLVAGTEYFAWWWFIDPSGNSRAKFTVDTYWNGDENYHQHFCAVIPPGPQDQDTAVDRGTAGCPS
jgi:hypothetical protein